MNIKLENRKGVVVNTSKPLDGKIDLYLTMPSVMPKREYRQSQNDRII